MDRFSGSDWNEVIKKESQSDRLHKVMGITFLYRLREASQTSAAYSGHQRVHNNIYPEFSIILRQEPFITVIIIPLAAVVFIAIQQGHPVINENSLQIIVNQVISPAIQFKGG